MKKVSEADSRVPLVCERCNQIVGSARYYVFLRSGLDPADRELPLASRLIQLNQEDLSYWRNAHTPSDCAAGERRRKAKFQDDVARKDQAA